MLSGLMPLSLVVHRSLALLGVVLLLALLSPLPPAPPVAAQPEPAIYFGSAIHPEAIFAKLTPTRLDLSRPGFRTPADLEREIVAARQAGLTMLRGGIPFDAIAPYESRRVSEAKQAALLEEHVHDAVEFVPARE